MIYRASTCVMWSMECHVTLHVCLSDGWKDVVCIQEYIFIKMLEDVRRDGSAKNHRNKVHHLGKCRDAK